MTNPAHRPIAPVCDLDCKLHKAAQDVVDVWRQAGPFATNYPIAQALVKLEAALRSS